MLAAGIIAALIAWIVASAYAWSWVMHQAALSEAEIWDFWEVEAAGKIAGGDRGKRSQRLPVTKANQTIQTEQTNSLHSNSRIMSGRTAK